MHGRSGVGLRGVHLLLFLDGFFELPARLLVALAAVVRGKGPGAGRLHCSKKCGVVGVIMVPFVPVRFLRSLCVLPKKRVHVDSHAAFPALVAFLRLHQCGAL